MKKLPLMWRPCKWIFICSYSQHVAFVWMNILTRIRMGDKIRAGKLGDFYLWYGYNLNFERRILQGLNPNLWTDLLLSDVLFFHTTHSGLNATNSKPLFIMSTSFGCQSWLKRTNCFKFLYDIDIEKIGLLWPLFWELLVITTWFYN